MIKYIIKRILQAIVVLLLVTCITFFLMKLVPGSPFASEKSQSPEALEALNKKYGLDQPYSVQLKKFIVNALHGEFGVFLKMQKNRPVMEIIKEMLPTSVKLGLIALLWATLVGVPLGSLAAYRSGDLDFVNSAPQEEIKKLLDTKELKTLPYVGTYFVCFNTEKKPFDNPKVRKAFSLAIDRNFIVDQVTGRGEKVASGYVPSGVYDEKGAKGDDFRTVGGDYYSVKSEDYEKNIKEAKKLMEEAGFKDGKASHK